MPSTFTDLKQADAERANSFGTPGGAALRVTIVSGLPRSGTSVTMQMIHAGGLPALTDAIRAADVDNPHGYYEFEPVKKTKADASWLAEAAGRVVKMVHLLLLDLPLVPPDGIRLPYRIIMTQREPDEVLASQSKMLQRLGRGGGAIAPEQLKTLYKQQMTKVMAHLTARPEAFAVMTLSYNALLADPQTAAGQVNEFLGGQLDVAKMAAAVDASLYRNRKG